MSEFHFLRPWWLLALLPAGVLAWRLWVRRDAGRSWHGIIAPHLLAQLLVGGDDRRRFGPLGLLIAAWVLTMTALAGPTWQREPAPFAEDSAALVIVLKVTPSMLTADVQPTRLARATEKIRDLLRLRPGAKTALYAYAGSVHRVLPLTDDAGIITTFAEELSPEVMPRPGDAAATALQTADEMLGKSEQRGSILWIVDAAAPDQRAALENYRRAGRTPVSVLTVANPGPERTSLEAAAAALGASTVPVTVDDADVQHLTRNAQYSAVAGPSGSDRWRDFGYWLVPPLAILSLVWFRRGWVILGGAG